MYQLQADHSDALSSILRSKIVEFNAEHFDAQRLPLGYKFTDEQGELVAGTSGCVFGNWLMISWLWCSDSARGKGLADKLLTALEQAAIELGATTAQLDTLDFQAKPFYEKRGYSVKYQLNNYPRSGTRYFMEKPL
ncbi:MULTISPECIES: GNAT family N-acetyltransferase [Pseudoalteromonas]|jgi:GNAT superfamily N-acetyltransferase|uniref:GNAT family N-acetyltransferase n=1 Tax=Pseudoalteromonas TaxID=53246 RepID=UPI0004255EBA|nr:MULTISPECIES: GNAT family N-acetyltransferase [Pseudoalteromonas]TVU72571.1 GNAT family N-acetyltransferase [Pseudoalteromonas elyakovii]|tara:strand:- start:269 stop:676 length:408 start_codon:yes stop_codon:yes gene_type:complete